MKNSRRVRGQVLSFVVAFVMMFSLFGFLPVRVEAAVATAPDYIRPTIAGVGNVTMAISTNGTVWAQRWPANSTNVMFQVGTFADAIAVHGGRVSNVNEEEFFVLRANGDLHRVWISGSTVTLSYRVTTNVRTVAVNDTTVVTVDTNNNLRNAANSVIRHNVADVITVRHSITSTAIFVLGTDGTVWRHDTNSYIMSDVVQLAGRATTTNAYVYALTNNGIVWRFNITTPNVRTEVTSGVTDISGRSFVTNDAVGVVFRRTNGVLEQRLGAATTQLATDTGSNIVQFAVTGAGSIVFQRANGDVFFQNAPTAPPAGIFGAMSLPNTHITHNNFEMVWDTSISGYRVTRFVGTVPAGGAVQIPSTGSATGRPVRAVDSGVFGVGVVPQAQRNSITSISFQAPSQVAIIQASAFSNLPNLRSVTIPVSVISIGSEALAFNPSLTDVHFLHTNGTTLRATGQGNVFADSTVFHNVPATMRLTRPVNADAATFVPFTSGQHTFNWFASDDNAAWWSFISADSTTTGPIIITDFRGPTNLTTINVPSTINGRTVVGFSTNAITGTNAPMLQEIVIPATVHTIPVNAIRSPNLRTVRLLHTNAAHLHTLHANAFDNNHTNATFRIIFPAEAVGFTVPTWRGFNTQADYGTVGQFITTNVGTGLQINGYTGTSPTIRIPESIGGVPVRYIGLNAFSNNTHLRELIIPASVVMVSPNAVNNAPNLEVVYLRHMNANTFTYFSTSAFTNVHPDFRIYFPMESTGFTAPTWRGYRTFPQRWSYTITGGQVTITGFYGTETTVVIPSSIQGFPVRTIAGETFINNQQITTLVIPASVTSIQRNAVFNCRSLHTVVLEHTNAATITNFAAYAFVGVAPNFRILFPDGATGFTTPVWRGYFAEALTGEIILQHGNFEYTIRRVTLPGTGNVSRDEVVILRYLGNSTSLVVPATIDGLVVAGLGDAAFFQNQTLTQITLPDTLRTIGNSTFSGALGLTTITIPASVTTIGANAFLGASNLQTARFMHQNGANVTFGDNTFANTSISPQFRILFPTGATGFSTPQWRGVLASPYGQATSTPTPTPPPGGLRTHTVRTTDTFPGVVGAPLIFRGGVGYVSMRAFALLIESDPQTEILFNSPTTGWATITGRHTNGSIINVSVMSNDHRAIVFINGVQHNETDMAGWAPQSGRARGQLRTINENGNIYLPFRAMSNIFGYHVEMLDASTVRFTALQ